MQHLCNIIVKKQIYKIAHSYKKGLSFSNHSKYVKMLEGEHANHVETLSLFAATYQRS